MDPWSLFWRQGHSTTFGDYFKHGYEGAVAEWWTRSLLDLPPAAVVLEVGCGNCSLLPVLIQTAQNGKYVGVDLAQVKPSLLAQERLAESGLDVVIHSGTPAEKIPEPDCSVDLLASVFGIEYSNLGQSLPEVARVLKPGGRFSALIHHEDSMVTSMSRRALAEYCPDDVASVVAALGEVSAQRDKIGSLTELKHSREAERARMLVNSMAEKYLGSTDLNTTNATMFEFMTSALKFFRMLNLDSGARTEFIDSLAREHDASNERFSQMVSVALGQSGIEKIQDSLNVLGFAENGVSICYSDNQILAWELCAVK